MSKKWGTLTTSPNLWKAAVYREIAVSSKNWARWDVDIAKGVDLTNEFLSLPDNIVENLRRSYEAFPGKSIIKTHVLVRMLKGITTKKLEGPKRKYFPSNVDGYEHSWKAVVDELGDKPAEESVWLFMTTKEIDGTKNQSYRVQNDIVADLARKAKLPYKIPTTLEAKICLLAENSQSSWSTRCQDKVSGTHVIVAIENRNGFFYTSYSINDDDAPGVAALCKF